MIVRVYVPGVKSVGTFPVNTGLYGRFSSKVFADKLVALVNRTPDGRSPPISNLVIFPVLSKASKLGANGRPWVTV